MKILIAAGGTGGHFYPGLALYHELKKRGDAVRFVIRRRDFVTPLLNREKISYGTISAGGFERRLCVQNFVSLFKLILGFAQSFFLLIRFRPDRVVVMGGYLSVPVALAARILSVPVILHEQNLKPGLANRCLDRLASQVAVSFDDSRRFFKTPSVVTGNPVRADFEQLPDRTEVCAAWNLDPRKKTILVFGGSLGAHRLNELMVQAVQGLSHRKESFQVCHWTGPQDEEMVRGAYESFGVQCNVESYCHEMPKAFSVCDLVVCRSGASTISELVAVKRPAILIPYPLATEAHQLANANLLAAWGVAHVYEESSLRNGELQGILSAFLLNGVALEEMKRRYSEIHLKPFLSAGLIADLVHHV